MFNQFIVVGKVCGIDYDTGIVVVSVSREYTMFNINANDLIDVRIPQNLISSLEHINEGDTIFIKGRMISAEMNYSVLLYAERMVIINSKAKEDC
ncbi:MAG: hypothetical protein ACI35S_05470 [Anaeroplasma sp.]